MLQLVFPQEQNDVTRKHSPVLRVQGNTNIIQYSLLQHPYIYLYTQVEKEKSEKLLREDLVSLAVCVDWIFGCKCDTAQHNADEDAVAEHTVIGDIIAKLAEPVQEKDRGVS